MVENSPKGRHICVVERNENGVDYGGTGSGGLIYRVTILYVTIV